MPKHYKEIVEDIINKKSSIRPPVRYSVKFSMRKGGEIRKVDKDKEKKVKKMVLAKGGKQSYLPKKYKKTLQNSVAGGVDLA